MRRKASRSSQAIGACPTGRRSRTVARSSPNTNEAEHFRCQIDRRLAAHGPRSRKPRRRRSSRKPPRRPALPWPPERSRWLVPDLSRVALEPPTVEVRLRTSGARGQNHSHPRPPLLDHDGARRLAVVDVALLLPDHGRRWFAVDIAACLLALDDNGVVACDAPHADCRAAAAAAAKATALAKFERFGQADSCDSVRRTFGARARQSCSQSGC